MENQAIINNIKNLGIFYGLIGLGACFPKYIWQDKYISIAYAILLVSTWFIFIKNLATFYKDTKLQLQNTIGNTLFIIGFVVITFLDIQSEADMTPTIAFIVLASAIAMIVGGYICIYNHL